MFWKADNMNQITGNQQTKENISIYFDNCYSRIKNIRENAKLVFRKSMSILIHKKHIHNL